MKPVDAFLLLLGSIDLPLLLPTAHLRAGVESFLRGRLLGAVIEGSVGAAADGLVLYEVR